MKLISEEVYEYSERKHKPAGALQRQQQLSTQRHRLSALEGRLQKVEASKKLRRVKKLMDTRNFSEDTMRRKRTASTRTMRKLILDSQKFRQDNRFARLEKVEASVRRRKALMNK